VVLVFCEYFIVSFQPVVRVGAVRTVVKDPSFFQPLDLRYLHLLLGQSLMTEEMNCLKTCAGYSWGQYWCDVVTCVSLLLCVCYL
jgi:hypothetical protein